MEVSARPRDSWPMRYEPLQDAPGEGGSRGVWWAAAAVAVAVALAAAGMALR